MHFGFALELSNVDLLNIDLLDTHLDLLDTDIPSKYFVCLHNVFKTSSRHVFKMSSRLTNTCWIQTEQLLNQTFSPSHNFSLVSRYLLKFTRCSLLVIKFLVTRCRIRSLLIAEVARCKKSLATRCEIHLLVVAEVARCKNSLVIHCKIHSLLVAEVACCKK